MNNKGNIGEAYAQFRKDLANDKDYLLHIKNSRCKADGFPLYFGIASAINDKETRILNNKILKWKRQE